MSDFDEVEFEISTSDDACTVTIEIKSKKELSYLDLLENMDFCYRELKRAYEQKTAAGTLEH